MVSGPTGRYRRMAGETQDGISWAGGKWWTALEAFPVFGDEESAFLWFVEIETLTIGWSGRGEEQRISNGVGGRSVMTPS